MPLRARPHAMLQLHNVRCEPLGGLRRQQVCEHGTRDDPVLGRRVREVRRPMQLPPADPLPMP